MSKEDGGVVSSEGISWRLSFRQVRIHNAHLQSGTATRGSCALCTQGLAGALAKVQEAPKPVDKDEVASSSGDHKERDTASPYGDWDNPGRGQF